jgi:hypothetical protein
VNKPYKCTYLIAGGPIYGVSGITVRNRSKRMGNRTYWFDIFFNDKSQNNLYIYNDVCSNKGVKNQFNLPENPELVMKDLHVVFGWVIA